MSDNNGYSNHLLTSISVQKEIVLRVYNDLNFSSAGISTAAIIGGVAEEMNALEVGKPLERVSQLGSDTLGDLYTHGMLADSYQYLKDNPTEWEKLKNTEGFTDKTAFKLQNPASFDVGYGNIQLYTAIDLLNKYNAEYPDTDPLNIKQYNSSYSNLANDLLNHKNPATVKFAGLVTKAAVSWFEANADNWSQLSVPEKESLIVFYYNVGEREMDRRKAEASPDADGTQPYNPDPYATPIAMEYLENRAGLEQALSGPSDPGDQDDYDAYINYLKEQLDKDYCFAAGTLVSLDGGVQRPIEDIQIGDRVAAFLEVEGGGSIAVGGDALPVVHNPLQSAPVTNLIRNSDQKLIEVNGVKVTPGHRFYCADGVFREIGNLAIGDLLVDADGNPVPITSIKDIPGLHDTYNLTVAGFHTYVAGGYRVHNDSLFYAQSEEGMLVDSIMDQVSAIIFADNPWGDILIGSAMRSIGSVTADVLFAGEEFSAEIFLGRYAINVIGSVGGYAARMLVEEAGEELGLPDEVTGALSIFASQAGTELAEYAALTFIADIAKPGSALANEASEALANQDVGAFLQGAAVAAIGSFAAMQLAELLGIDDEYSAFLTAPTRAAVNQIGNNIVDGIPWHTNVANVALNALGSVAGSFLANEIGQFDTYTEQLGSSIGSAIGGQIGQFLIPIPFVGAFIGSLVGGLIGGFIGGLFGDDPIGFAEMSFDTATDSFYISAVYGEDKNAEKIAKDVAESAENTLESLLDTIGGDVLSERIGTRTFEYDDGDFALHRPGGTLNFGEDVEKMINRAVVEIVAELKIAGGDPYLKRAMALTLERVVDGGVPGPEAIDADEPAEGYNTLAAKSVLNDLKVGDLVTIDNALGYLTNSLIVAQEYKKYLENTKEINALIAADPDSEFAIGWQITLAQAFNLGLHRRHESDWIGGWDWWLGDKSVTADNVKFGYQQGERWFLTSDGDELEVARDTIAPGEKDSISGTDGSDVIAVNHDRYATSSHAGDVDSEIGLNGTVQENETLIGFAARLKGGDGDDLIIGGNLGNDLFGEAGNDKLIGGALDDWLYGGSGADILISGGGNGNVLDGGDGNDRVFGSDGEDWLIGGAGDDVLRGADGDDILDAGAGRDIVDGGKGNDTYIYRPGDGLTVLADSGQDSEDKLLFGDGIDPEDLIIARADNGLDLIVTFANGEPGDRLVLRGMLTNGQGGIDLVRFADGTEWDRGAIIAASVVVTAQGVTRTGSAADETIEGSNYADDLSGGAGVDTLTGGEGSDVYRFNRGDGQDEIVDRGLLGDIDRVVFGPDIALTDLTFERRQDALDKLVIKIKDTDDALTVGIHANGWSDGVEFFRFADGTELSLTDINRIYLGHNVSDNDDLVLGLDTSERIATGDGNDTLSGGRGNDYLLGGNGDDTYLFEKGDGFDVIDDSLGQDILQFGDGIGPNDIRLSASLLNSKSLILEIPGSGDRVEIINGLDNTTFDRIEEIRFADGTIWTLADVQQKLADQNSSRWSDYVIGTDHDDVISAGDDNDRAYGHDGDDQITGGKGDDVLIGGWGSDTYFYNVGDGRDVIHTLHSGSQDVDRIVFGEGITTDNITVDRLVRNLDLRVTFADGDWLTILKGGESRYNYYVNEYEFADGTILDREGFYDLARANWTSEANDIVHGFNSADVIEAGAGNDRVYGNNGDDRITGGAGRDALIGGYDDDTYVYNLGDGTDTIYEGHVSTDADVLEFGAGITVDSLDVERTFRNLNIRITLEDGNWILVDNGGETRWGTGIEFLRFADGTELTHEEFFDLARATWTSASNDIVHGFNSADVLNAGAGDDYVYGNHGADDITGGTGNDVLHGGGDGDTYRYNLGDGNDTIVEGIDSGTDTLIFGEGITTDNILVERTARSQNFRITFENGEWILIRKMAETRFKEGIEEFQFADGTVLDRQQFYDLAAAAWTTDAKDTVYGVNWSDTIDGGAGDDRLNGYGGDDHLTGGLGNDYLAGGSDADTYYFNLGDGYDIIWDEKISGGANDKLVLGAGITADMISVVNVPWHSNTVRLNFGNGDAIQLIDQLGSYNGGIETIVFADGTQWTAADIASAISSSGIVGTGGSGADVFGYDRGNGLAYFNGNFGDDHLNIDGIGLSEIDFGFDPKNSDRLTLSVRGTNDEFSLLSIETVSFNGGGNVSLQSLWNHALSQNSTAGDDRLIGSDYGDTISAGDGDDVIEAHHGADQITGGKGDDRAFGSWGNDTYHFNLGDGIDFFDGSFDEDTLSFGAGISLADLQLSYDVTDADYLVVSIAGTADQVGIQDVETIRFADGSSMSYGALTQLHVDQRSTSGDDYINGFETSETISAGAGNDQIYADKGNDTIIGGTGDDYAAGSWGNDVYIFSRGDGRDVFKGEFDTDTLRFGPDISSSDVTTFTDVTDQNYLTFAINGTFDQISIDEVERVEFSDRTLGSQSEIFQFFVDQQITAGDDYINSFETSEVINAGAGDDQIYADHGNDQISGGTGDDYADGSWGNDTYTFNLGDGQDIFDGGFDTDTLIFGEGISYQDIVLGRDENSSDMISLSIAGTTDVVTIKETEIIQFADGTSWTINELYQRYVDQVSTSGHDRIFSFGGSQTIDGGTGDDWIDAGRGNDTIRGGTGNDHVFGGWDNDVYIFERGDGNDVFEGGLGTDTLRFGPGIELADLVLTKDSRNSNFVLISIRGSNDSVSVKDVSKVEFNDGSSVSLSSLIQTALLSSDSTVDVLGTGSADQLVGTSGDDQIVGYGGDDTLIGGQGSDIYRYSLGDGSDRIVDAEAGGADVLDLAEGISPDDVRVFVSPANAADLVIEILTDGSQIVLVGQLASTTTGIEEVRFADGTVWTRADLTGAADNGGATVGDDVLYGSIWADTLDGGRGDDVLKGGLGNDDYVFELGDGEDVVEEVGGSQSVDRIVFGEGISAQDIQFSRSGDQQQDLVVSYSSTDQVLIKNQFAIGQAGITSILLFDGSVIDVAQIQAALTASAGTDSDETLLGFDSADTLMGQAGDDLLDGKAGGDTYIFNPGDGHDTIADTGMDDGIDTLSFGNGISADDVRIEQRQDGTYVLRDEALTWSVSLLDRPDRPFGGLETITFADGTLWQAADLEQLYYASETRIGGDGQIFGNSNDNTIEGGDTDEAIFGGRGNDTLDGGGGSDVLLGGDGNDTLKGGLGDDTLEGGLGLDSYDGGEGEDTVSFEYSNAEWTIDLAAGTAATAANPDGAETLTAVENIRGSQNSDTITGDGAANKLFGNGGADDLNGGAGNDLLQGGAGADTLEGGTGDDVLQGGSDDDVYQYASGDGIDSLIEAEGEGAADVLVLGPGLLPADIQVTQAEDDVADVTLTFLDGGSVTLEDQFAILDETGIETIRFDDGSEWSKDRLAEIAMEQASTAGDDTIRGFNDRGDVITGGAGNDTIDGGAGNDSYHYSLGDGNDVLTDLAGNGDADRLVLGAGIDPGTLRIFRESLQTVDAYLVFPDGSWIVLKDQYRTDAEIGIERLEFQDGTVWGKAEIEAHTTLNAKPVAVADSFNILLDGDSFELSGDTILANDVDDSTLTLVSATADANGSVELSPEGNLVVTPIDGFTGDMVITYVVSDGFFQTQGTVTVSVSAINDPATDDNLTGTDDDDLMFGGKGDDTLNGGKGNDTYIYRLGDGTDKITETYSKGSADRLELRSGILAAEVTATRSSSDKDDITLHFVDGGSILLDEQFYDSYNRTQSGVEEITFADGTVWGVEDLMAAYFRTALTDAADTVIGFNKGDDVIDAGDGNDDVTSYGGEDTITGGLGNDILRGGSGNDTYIYRLGDGNDTIEDTYSSGAADRLELGAGINVADVTVSRSSSNRNDATLHFADGGSIVLDNQYYDSYGRTQGGIEQIVFADGTIWGTADIMARYFENAITEGSDTIVGFNQADDSVDAGAGNDTIYTYGGSDDLTGGLGNDTLIGGSGNDTYHYQLGDGNDVIDEEYNGGSSDRLELGDQILTSEVTFSRTTSDRTDLKIHFADGGTILLDGQYYDSFSRTGAGVEEIAFADGTVWTVTDVRARYFEIALTDGDDNVVGFNKGNDVVDAGTGNDTISTYGGADVITGGLGNDTLIGGSGNDTYHYQLGDGNDVIDEDYNGGSSDRLELGDQILASEVTFSRTTSDRTDLKIHFADGGTILLDGQYYDSFSRTGAGVEEIAFADGTVWTVTDVRARYFEIALTDGDDNVVGFNKGNDVVDAGTGSDTISTYGGADVITGGLGNDVIDGGGGDDVYIYNLGDGDDTIKETYNNGSGDRLELGAGILAAEVGIQMSASDDDDITLVLAGGGSIILDEQFYDSYSRKQAGVEQIVFDDGTIWSHDDLRLMRTEGTANDDTLIGTTGDDVLSAGAGNDTIQSGKGNDTLNGGGGNDALTGGSGNDVFVFASSANGSDTVTDFAAGDGAGDVLEFASALFADFASVLAAASDDGSDTSIVLSVDETLVLQGVVVSDLHADDFRFV